MSSKEALFILHTSIPYALLEWLTEEAQREGKTRAAYVREVLQAHRDSVEQEGPQ